MAENRLAQHFSGPHLGQEGRRRLGEEMGLVLWLERARGCAYAIPIRALGGENVLRLFRLRARTVRFVVVVAYGAVPRRTLSLIF